MYFKFPGGNGKMIRQFEWWEGFGWNSFFKWGVFEFWMETWGARRGGDGRWMEEEEEDDEDEDEEEEEKEEEDDDDEHGSS